MRKIIDAHRFFIKTTPSYVGKWVEMSSPYDNDTFGRVRFGYYRISLRDKLYMPIAYIKYMYYVLTF